MSTRKKRSKTAADAIPTIADAAAAPAAAALAAAPAAPAAAAADTAAATKSSSQELPKHNGAVRKSKKKSSAPSTVSDVSHTSSNISSSSRSTAEPVLFAEDLVAERKRRPGRPCKHQRPAPVPRQGIVEKPNTPGSVMELATTGHKWIKRTLGAFQRTEHLLLCTDPQGMSLAPEGERLLARFQGAELHRFYARPELFCGRISTKKFQKALSGLDNSDHLISLTARVGKRSRIIVEISGEARRSQTELDLEPLDAADIPTELQTPWRVSPPGGPPTLTPQRNLHFDLTFRMSAIELKKIYNKFEQGATLQLTFQDKDIVFQQERDDSIREYINRQQRGLVIAPGLSEFDLGNTVVSINRQMLQGIVPTHNADEEVVNISATRDGRLLIEKVDQTGGFGLRLLV